MARTPTMRSLLRLIRDRADAEAQGITPEQVREQRAERAVKQPSGGTTRRRFLLGSAGAAAAIVLPRAAHSGERAQPRIAIVGAGIAGLSAALTLRDAGVEATVYEAAGRVGGRMFSNQGYFADGQVSEWCGELIDTGHTTVQDLAARFGLPLDNLLSAEPEGAAEVYHFDGHYYDKRQADTDFAAVYRPLRQDYRAARYPTTFDHSTLTGRMLDDMSIFDWIEWRVPGGHAAPLGQLFDVAYNIEYGAETTDQSALNLIYLMADQPRRHQLSLFGVSDETYHIRGGNQRLPQAIAAHLGDRVRLGLRLSSLRRTAGGAYDLTFHGGGRTEEVRADLVLLALPFAVLSGLDYSAAGFDDLKIEAIRELGRGRNGKLQLQFGGRPWNGRGPWPGVGSGATYGDTGYQATWEVTRAQPGAHGILCNFTGGDTTAGMAARGAFGLASNAQVRADARRFLGQIDPVLPGLRPLWNERATSAIPHRDPNFGLSYSYFRVGQYHRFGGYEGVRQRGVLFAGEHTSPDFQGFMEGGASEGVRAAEDILRLIAKK